MPHPRQPAPAPSSAATPPDAKSGGRLSRARSEALLDLLYQAAAEPPLWQQFVETLSRALDEAPISLWLSLPNREEPPVWFRVGLDQDRLPELRRYFDVDEMPWGTNLGPAVTERFITLEGVVSEADLERSGFYRDYLAPQGIAASTPIMHAFGQRAGGVAAAIVIYQLARKPRFGPAQPEFCNRLVPHLARAHALHRKMRLAERKQSVLSEVIDRMPSGIVLLDTEGRVLFTNAGAQRIAEAHRGLIFENARVVATHPQQNRELQALISRALTPRADVLLDVADVLMIQGSEGADPLPLLVTRLEIPLVHLPDAQAAAAIFLGEPPIIRPGARRVLKSLYDLTEAEADLALSIAEGLTVEQIAEQRGVKVSTARSQLKRAFAKTGANRQSDLVRIVLGGVAALQSRSAPGGTLGADDGGPSRT